MEAEKIAQRVVKSVKKPVVSKYAYFKLLDHVFNFLNRAKAKTPEDKKHEEKKIESPGNFVAEKTAKKTVNKQTTVVENKVDNKAMKVSNNKISKKPNSVSPELKPLKE